LGQELAAADYNDTINVGVDGSAAVRERLTLVFIGEWHASIALFLSNTLSERHQLHIVDRCRWRHRHDGQKLKYESRITRGLRDLRFDSDAVDTTRTVEITYNVRNGIRYFEDHDEFYWNVTGNDWPVPIDHASALVNLPSAQRGRCEPKPLLRLWVGRTRSYL